jgi:hypothetical protein
LHARILRYSKKHAEVGQHLLAIKWLGNSGSHSDDLRAQDALDGFELLEHALEEVYELKSAKLKKLAATIIKKNPFHKKRARPIVSKTYYEPRLPISNSDLRDWAQRKNVVFLLVLKRGDCDP